MKALGRGRHGHLLESILALTAAGCLVVFAHLATSSNPLHTPAEPGVGAIQPPHHDTETITVVAAPPHPGHDERTAAAGGALGTEATAAQAPEVTLSRIQPAVSFLASSPKGSSRSTGGGKTPSSGPRPSSSGTNKPAGGPGNDSGQGPVASPGNPPPPSLAPSALPRPGPGKSDRAPGHIKAKTKAPKGNHGRSAWAPGHGGTPPGHGGTPPGHVGNPHPNDHAFKSFASHRAKTPPGHATKPHPSHSGEHEASPDHPHPTPGSHGHSSKPPRSHGHSAAARQHGDGEGRD